MFLDFLFPAQIFTRQQLDSISLVQHSETTAQLRARNIYYLDELIAVCSYHEKTVQQLVYFWKYRRLHNLQNTVCSLFVKGSFPQVEKAVLCPVPLHWSRLFWRGFNQAEVLADAIAAQNNMAVLPLIQRKKPTGHQAHRTRKQRFSAMQNVFTCSQKVPVDTVILIDDVATTCATLNSCAKVLKQAGVQKVLAWTLAFD